MVILLSSPLHWLRQHGLYTPRWVEVYDGLKQVWVKEFTVRSSERDAYKRMNPQGSGYFNCLLIKMCYRNTWSCSLIFDSNLRITNRCKIPIWVQALVELLWPVLVPHSLVSYFISAILLELPSYGKLTQLSIRGWQCLHGNVLRRENQITNRLPLLSIYSKVSKWIFVYIMENMFFLQTIYMFNYTFN
jgi:hypothetical protein